VKSAKVSLAPVVKVETNAVGKKLHVVDETLPCESLGYGFVCFESEDHANAVIGSKDFGAIEAIKFSPKDPKEATKRISNNIYIKNFDASWTEEKIKQVFSNFGLIKSVFVKEEQVQPKEGGEPQLRKFAFVCFEDAKDKDAGFVSAERAVQELNDKEVEGQKLYVQPALTAIQRQVVIQREQQRFKNSKKKCNLFVKNFPEGFSVEELRPHFARFGEIESIKILPSHDGQPSTRAFVCFKQPDCAAYARANLHGSALNGKQLYVTNYELPEIRRKQQAEAKDRADFFNQRKQVTQNQFDVNILQKPETIQLIQQILFLMQKQFNGRMPF
jgi:polyadenylate-binding protein